MNTRLTREPAYVSVYRSKELHLISLYKLVLEEHNIPVVIFDQRDSSYNAFGDIYLNVPARHESEALKILKEHE